VNGILKRIVSERDFGFLKGDDGKEYFSTARSVDEGTSFADMSEGDTVSFEQEPGSAKGPRARRVSLGATVGSVSP
jgi:cold shock CspA family protein